jgi:hypothetical protein
MYRQLVAVAVASVFCTAASAAPTLSGNYSLSVHNYCQAVATVDSTTGLLTFKNRRDLGLTGVFAGTINFNAGAGTYSSTGVNLYGSNTVEKFTDGSKKGLDAKYYNGTDSGTYSNTDTTVTFKGTDTYMVAYGHVDGNGVADSLTGVWKVNDHCMYQFDMQIQ